MPHTIFLNHTHKHCKLNQTKLKDIVTLLYKKVNTEYVSPLTYHPIACFTLQKKKLQ